MFSILLELGTFNKINMVVLHNGSRVSPFSVSIPTTLRQLARKSISYGFSEQDIIDFLSDYETYPIILQIDKEEIEATWDRDFCLTKNTICDVQEGQVQMMRVGIFGRLVCTDLFVLGKRLVVCLKHRKIGLMGSSSGWVLWNHFYQKLYEKAEMDPLSRPSSISDDFMANTKLVDDPNLAVSMSFFNNEQISFCRDWPIAQSYTLKGAREKQIKPRYRLSVFPTRQGVVMIRPECLVGDHNVGLQKRLFLRFFKLKGLPNRVRSSSYWESLQDALVTLIVAPKTNLEACLSEILSDPLFDQDGVKAHIQNYLEEFIMLINETHHRLVVIESSWYLMQEDLLKEGLLYRDLIKRFGIHLSSLEDELSLTVRQSNFVAAISDLQDVCKSLGIDFVYNNKEIKTVSWDFEVDMTDPETAIQAMAVDNQGVVETDLWQSFLDGDGFFEQGDQVKVLDEKTRKILETVFTLLKTERQTKRVKKEIEAQDRLKILDWFYLHRYGVTFKLSEQDRTLFNRLLGLENIPTYDLPKSLKGQLRDYQKSGYAWLCFLYESGFGACLADDMGLGKTIQALCLVAAIQNGDLKSKNGSLHHLVVVPPSLLFNWVHEFKTFFPELNVYEYVGKDRAIPKKGVDVVLTTYDIVRIDIKKLAKRQFTTIIFDEAQLVKNIYSGRTSAVRQLKGDFKCCLTGTPVENHLGEYFSIIDLVLPGLLETYQTFHQKTRSGEGDYLLRRTRPFVLRRTKSNILKELPEKSENTVRLSLTDTQKQFYGTIIKQVRDKVSQAYEKTTKAQARITALTALLRLRQLCISPQILEPTESYVSPKIKYLIDKVQELKSEGHSCLIFTQFRTVLDLIETQFDDLDIPFFRLDGTTPVKKRRDIINAFQEGEEPAVFMISLKAGGLGLNLTKASYVFLLDPWWNPAVENQATDRAHRIGQTQKVFVSRLIMHHTVEEKMMILKEKKSHLFDKVMSYGLKQYQDLKLTKEDFDFLLDTNSE